MPIIQSQFPRWGIIIIHWCIQTCCPHCSCYIMKWVVPLNASMCRPNEALIFHYLILHFIQLLSISVCEAVSQIFGLIHGPYIMFAMYERLPNCFLKWLFISLHVIKILPVVGERSYASPFSSQEWPLRQSHGVHGFFDGLQF